jgi:hypothetical protein
MTQPRALAFAAVALALAAGLALLAVDVLHRDDSLAAGDVRYALNPGDKHLWHASEILPFGAARTALGVDDDLRYRNAVRLFLLGQPRASIGLGLAPARAQAQGALEAAIAAESDAERKSALINMVGVIAVSNAASALLTDPSAVNESISAFRRAIEADPGNINAKANLELVLRVLERQQRQRQHRRGALQRRTGSRAGLGAAGRGY